VGADIVAHDIAAIGPADEDRPVESKLVDDGCNIVGPPSRVM
jgi:hypothetical protein